LSLLKTLIAGLLILTAMLCGHRITAQQKVDSLWQVVTNSIGLERGRALVVLGKAMGETRRDEALLYLDSAATIFYELDAKTDWAKAEAEKIYLFTQISLNYRAVRSFEKLDTLVNLLKSDSIYNKVKQAVALAYGELNKPESGIGLLYEVLGRYRQAGDTLGQISILDYLTNDAFAPSNKRKNISLYDSVISLASQFSQMNPADFSRIYNNYASDLIALGLFDEAEISLRKAEELARLSKEPEVEHLFIQFTSAELALGKGDLLRCKYYLGNCSKLLDSADSDFDRMVIMEARSHFYLLDGDRTESDLWFERSRKLADSSGDRGQIEEMYFLRSRILKAQGIYKDALEHYEMWEHFKDSNNISQQEAKIAELRIVNETELAESENLLLRQQNENILFNKKESSRFFIAILIVVLIAGGILVFFLARTRRLNNSISSQNDRLAAQNDRLVQLTEDNELLMGIVAHDLKAPLTKIESLIGLLVPRESLDEGKKELLDMTIGVIEGGKNLVTDMLILNEAGRGTTPDLVPANLGDLIQAVSRDFQEIADRKEIKINLLHPDARIMPLLHPPYLIRVLDNLISNAIKFSPRGSKVEISWGEDDRGAWCTVADFGPGITAEEQERLFERFAKLSNRPTEGESSTGLGLFIVKTLLDAMDASIALKSQPGEGSAFTILFSSPSDES
jgi:signal transduction histidine kinase